MVCTMRWYNSVGLIQWKLLTKSLSLCTFFKYFEALLWLLLKLRRSLVIVEWLRAIDTIFSLWGLTNSAWNVSKPSSRNSIATRVATTKLITSGTKWSFQSRVISIVSMVVSMLSCSVTCVFLYLVIILSQQYYFPNSLCLVPAEILHNTQARLNYVIKN